MQSELELLYHPVNLAVHGLNTYGRPLYRVIWADTRMTTVICAGKRYQFPRYRNEPETKGQWVLEKWAPSEVIWGMTRDQYEAFLALYPNAAGEEYSASGDYELSRIFNEPSGPFCHNIDEAALHQQLAFHEWKHARMTDADRAREVIAAEDAKEAAQDKEFEDKYDEAKEKSQCLM